MIRRAAVVALALCAACATSRGPSPAAGVAAPLTCTPPAAPMVRSALYFGLRRPGGDVSPEEWAQFLAREVTPRFGGLTVFEAQGQWLGSDGPLVREATRVVVILHPDRDAPRTAIAEVIRRYRARFEQQSVLWETTAACAAY